MNVGLISREYPPFFGGGIGTYTVQWAKTLARGGHRVVVVTVSDDGEVKREETDGVVVVRLPFLKGTDWARPHPAIASDEVVAAFRQIHPVAAFGMQVERAMPELAREFALEVIEVPDTGALAWFGLNNRRSGGSWSEMPPVVTMIHSPSAWIAEHNRQPFLRRVDHELSAIECESAQWSDALITPSHAMADWARRHWRVDGRIEVIPYSLGDLQGGAPQAEAREVNGEFKLLFVGRLEPRKGIDTLLEAVGMVGDRRVILDAVGEDTLDPERPGYFGDNSLRAMSSKAAQAEIRLVGRRPPEEVAGFRGSADAVVIPSPMDNFPYVCVEAMSEGRLVVASAAGGTGEMIRDGVDGFLFEPGNAGACARAIESAAALSAPERRRMQASAAERIRELCGNQAILARRIGHYQRVIDGGRARPAVRDAEPVVCVSRGQAPDRAIERLTRALRETGDDFAHGWVSTEFGVQAFTTPRLRTLGLSTRVLGPLVVREAALERAGVKELLRRGADGELVAASTWSVAVELCAAGCTGVCVPEVVCEVATEEHHPVDRAMLEELKSIHASRGWWVLSRVYDLLHLVRGRGLRRPYHLRDRIG